jgi:NDP-sugar pyrophosphorylase family protein
MRAMVFAAGLGTRLRPLTEELAKPAVPVLHRPLVGYALDRLRRAGATDVVVNVHHRAEDVERAAGAGVVFAREERLLGTGGGLANAVHVQSRSLGRDLDRDELLVAFNSDIVFDADLEAAIAHHRTLGAFATMVLRADPEVARYGAIEIDASGVVRRLLGAPDAIPGLRPLMFTGVHVLSARAIADLPDEGCVIREGYRRWLDRGESIAGFEDARPWRDLGTPREYLAANLDLARGALRWPGHAPAAIHPSARVEGEVVDCVVGERAEIARGVRLERCVVWPGTPVRADARDAILIPGSIVPA